jgi:hypothetical protein
VPAIFCDMSHQMAGVPGHFFGLSSENAGYPVHFTGNPIVAPAGTRPPFLSHYVETAGYPPTTFNASPKNGGLPASIGETGSKTAGYPRFAARSKVSSRCTE